MSVLNRESLSPRLHPALAALKSWAPVLLVIGMALYAGMTFYMESRAARPHTDVVPGVSPNPEDAPMRHSATRVIEWRQYGHGDGASVASPQPLYGRLDVQHQTYAMHGKQLMNAKHANDLSMLSIAGVVSVSVTRRGETLHRTRLKNPARVWFKDGPDDAKYLYWYEVGTEHILSVPHSERITLDVCQPVKRKRVKSPCRRIRL